MKQRNIEHIHILVVDDEESVRNMLQQAIKGTGYDCSNAGNAKDALTILE